MKRNFLLGRGERLTEGVFVKTGPVPKVAPYTITEAKQRLGPKLSEASSYLDDLPDMACPDDNTVVSLTLNPEYIAKSYYPRSLLKEAGLEAVGSRSRSLLPEKKSRNREPSEALTTELFVYGTREKIRAWSTELTSWSETSKAGEDLVSIEDISAPTPIQKIKGDLPKNQHLAFEIVLHADELYGENFAVPKFREYLQSIGIDAELDRRFYAGGLCFLELGAQSEGTQDIAAFSMVRAIRQMPQLRVLRPTVRTSGLPTQSLRMPSEPAVDPNIKVAIFDGGVSENSPMAPWVSNLQVEGVGEPSADYIEHGSGVTSAFLFGHIDPTSSLPQPFANVEHFRVLDTEPGQNPFELYEVLERIDSVLASRNFDFINLSLGPRLPITDDDVHAWTAVLDDRLSKTDSLATIAVGNDGEGDSILGMDRIQPPADCVNALAIGACDSPDEQWQRAPYSSIGPGRCPGVVKPDLVEFGGSMQRPFLALSQAEEPTLQTTGGTSFSSPSVLRLAAGVRAHFGADLGHLAIRTLLVHQCQLSELPIEEIGHGRVARDLDELVLCGDDTIRVVYQGKISPAKYVRASIPMPFSGLEGMVTIKATLAFKAQTDPHHPGNYTRAGLNPVFRPHSEKFKNEDQLHPNTASFFSSASPKSTELELRSDAMKWENCIHSTKRMRGASLLNPVFDIHYNSRLEGRNFTPNVELPYALVISVQAKKMANLYDQVVRDYATILEPIKPVIEIPIQP